jgi:hypothetical protein
MKRTVLTVLSVVVHPLVVENCCARSHSHCLPVTARQHDALWSVIPNTKLTENRRCRDGKTPGGLTSAHECWSSKVKWPSQVNPASSGTLVQKPMTGSRWWSCDGTALHSQQVTMQDLLKEDQQLRSSAGYSFRIPVFQFWRADFARSAAK